MLHIANALLNVAFTAFHFLTGENPRSAVGYLKFLDTVCGIFIGSTFIIKIFLSHLIQNQAWASLVLLFIIGLKYLLSRISVKQELAIGRSLFPPGRIPNDLETTDRRSIAIQVCAFMLLYVALAILANHILIASLFMMLIAFGDFRTRDLISEHMKVRLENEDYAPRPEEPEYQAIMKRREIARWYLFFLPHLSKELACIDGCAVAFGLTVCSYVFRMDLDLAAYATLIGTQILNEIITIWWRTDRFIRLKSAGG